MNQNKIKNKIKNDNHQPGSESVLLAHLPFWSPLIPPMGVASLKGFLKKYGYPVRGVDLNVEKRCKQLYEQYFNVFKKHTPKEKRGNFYHIGHDVLQQHMMAHINYTDEDEYFNLVKILIDTIFYNDASEEQVREHIDVMTKFYLHLEDYFLKLFDEVKPTVLGLTVYKGTLPPALFVFRLAKKAVPGIKTVMGGGIFINTLIKGTEGMDEFLESTRDYIDKIMIGKGEPFMLKFLRGELPESQRVFTMADVEGEGSAPFSSILPDFSDFELSSYPYLAAASSKGCLYQCSFCNAGKFFGGYNQREIPQAVNEMITLNKNHGSRIFFMTDSLLNPIVTDLSRGIADTGQALYFDGYFRVDEAAYDFELTRQWRQGGFYRARLGVESGSQKILDLMDKQITVAQTKKVLSQLAYVGIKPTAYFVVGHPGETEEDFQLTLKLLEEIRNDIWQAECSPFYYYIGQPGADEWADKKKRVYPAEAREMLMMETWRIDLEPTREELYSRVSRFADHCKKLGIPNPYTLEEIFQADERWQKLHTNGVPSLLALMNADENFKEEIDIKKPLLAVNSKNYDNEFAF